MTSNSTFWLGKRVLVTGHTGFKGGWLSLWLQQLGAEVIGVALAPNTVPNLFELADIKNGMISHFCDIRDADKIKQIIKEANPEIVFHLWCVRVTAIHWQHMPPMLWVLPMCLML